MELLQREKHFKCKEKVLGQFFTPPEVSDFIVSFTLVNLVNAKSGCDPACGDGVFLSSMIEHGLNEVVGMDIDKKCIESIPKALKEKVKLSIGDALQRKQTVNGSFPPLQENHFDIVVGNPPFSAKYGRIKNKAILSDYKLGLDRKSQAIEILFLERFIQLAKKGGIIGIILPDGVFLNLNYKRVREFVLNNCRVLAVISLPRAIFNSSKTTTSKTSVLFLMKGQKHEGEVFMAQAKSINELQQILELYKNRKVGANARWVSISSNSLHPNSYSISESIKFKLPSTRLEELITEMFCGSTQYGEKRKFSDNGIRFISAKVITPLGIDFTREQRKYVEPGSVMDKRKAHVKVGDVLFVRVGVGCIGRAAVVVDENDLGIADDWIYIIRVKKGYSPYYLAIFLQSKYGKMQIDNAKRGVGTVTIPQRLLKEMWIPIPEAEFQDMLEREYKKMLELRRKGSYYEAKKIFENMRMKVEHKACGNQSC
jgi:type I restriction enzyme M protein